MDWTRGRAPMTQIEGAVLVNPEVILHFDPSTLMKQASARAHAAHTTPACACCPLP